MLFQSPAFGIFLVVLLGLYWAIASKRRARYWLLLVGAYYFYGSYEFWYLGLIIGSTFLDYWCGGKIHNAPNQRTRKRFLLLSLFGNLGTLCFFKYTDWLIESVEYFFGLAGIDPGITTWKLEFLPDFLYSPGTTSILVPVGISFYTLQTLSYTIDIYRRQLEPARNLQEFALFVAFFPQLVAGPIVRAITFLPQLENLPHARRDEIHGALYRFGQGIFKKVVLADVMGRFVVDPVFNDPGQFSFWAHLLCMYAFTLQIYYDFSGYSDCAIGTARLFGFRLPENFLTPYKSRSIREFWRRWHVSLSFWVRDYVYFPLGGSRCREVRVIFNLFVTMLVIAIWHGASILWVYYGLFQGAVMSLERWWERMRGGKPFATTTFKQGLSWFLTFHFVCFTCLFIRAKDHANIVEILTSFGDQEITNLWGLLAMAAAVLTHFQPERVHFGFVRRLVALPTPVIGFLLGIVAGIVAIIAVGDTPFIYFAF